MRRERGLSSVERSICNATMGLIRCCPARCGGETPVRTTPLSTTSKIYWLLIILNYDSKMAKNACECLRTVFEIVLLIALFFYISSVIFNDSFYVRPALSTFWVTFGIHKWVTLDAVHGLTYFWHGKTYNNGKQAAFTYKHYKKVHKNREQRTR